MSSDLIEVIDKFGDATDDMFGKISEWMSIEKFKMISALE